MIGKLIILLICICTTVFYLHTEGFESDPCAGIKPSDPASKIPLECFRKEFLKTGCSKDGLWYPKDDRPFAENGKKISSCMPGATKDFRECGTGTVEEAGTKLLYASNSSAYVKECLGPQCRVGYTANTEIFGADVVKCNSDEMLVRFQELESDSSNPKSKKQYAYICCKTPVASAPTTSVPAAPAIASLNVAPTALSDATATPKVNKVPKVPKHSQHTMAQHILQHDPSHASHHASHDSQHAVYVPIQVPPEGIIDQGLPGCDDECDDEAFQNLL